MDKLAPARSISLCNNERVSNEEKPHISTRIILLEKSDVIKRLGVSERTLENLMKDRKFPRGLKLGKNAKWDEAAVELWLAQALAHQLTWSTSKKPSRVGRTN
jgi:predicted DNA-binding transcriptional regulator AlpA